MTFTNACGKPRWAGIARAAWKGDDTRAVPIDGEWMIVEDDDEHTNRGVSDEDRAAEDWYVLRGNEWSMAREVELVPLLPQR